MSIVSVLALLLTRHKLWPLNTLLFLLLASGNIAREPFRQQRPTTEYYHQFPDDVLTPYLPGEHGSTRTTREIGECLHTSWENRTVETYQLTIEHPKSTKVNYKMYKFADVVHRGPLRRRYAVGTITYVEDPYHTLSVLEPLHKGTCVDGKNFYTPTATVQETASHRKTGCRLAANAGYFTVGNGGCLGNIVSDGRVVQTSGGSQNANFGIKEDGTIVIGYIPDEEIYDTINPFRQLIAGVVWLVRNGTNYVNESKFLECSDHEDTGRIETFVNVLSARSAIGHDTEGRLVIARVEGQTHVRGANLYEFADILVKRGVVNAINLDGGGSNTLVENGILLNYPSDHCHNDPQYRCPRSVSTILCIHDVECLDPECSNHGSCDLDTCSCDQPWTGEICDTLNCSLVNCSNHGNCKEGKCHCDSGWTGDFCDKRCSPNKYGPGCGYYCHCYGSSICDPVNGTCTCRPGYTGRWCWTRCSEGYYGVNCMYKCQSNCSGHGKCSTVNGLCYCHKGWTGISCNKQITNTTISPPPLTSPSPSLSLDHTSNNDTSLVELTTSSTSVQTISSNITLYTTTIGICTPNTNSTMPSYLPTTESQFIAMLILTGVGTVFLHLLLCLLNICWCNKVGMYFNKTDIKRELMERRQWHQMILESRKWSTSSSEADNDH